MLPNLTVQSEAFYQDLLRIMKAPVTNNSCLMYMLICRLMLPLSAIFPSNDKDPVTSHAVPAHSISCIILDITNTSCLFSSWFPVKSLHDIIASFLSLLFLLYCLPIPLFFARLSCYPRVHAFQIFSLFFLV